MHKRRFNRKVIVSVFTALITALGSSLLFIGEGAFADTVIVQDTNQGTGLGQVQFSANWNLCTTTCSKASDNSYRWTSTAGSTATVRFTGSQIKLFGVKEPWSNIATVSIDGGPAVDVDFYANPATGTVVEVYSSPALANATHTLVLTMTSRRNPLSGGGSAITFDRAEFLTGGTPSPSPTPGETTTVIQDTQQGAGVGQVQFSANWNLCTTTCSKASDNSYRWTSTTGASATVRFSGHQIKLFGVKEPWSNIATVSIDGDPAVDVDFYASPATATVVQVYQSPVLAEGTHTLVLTMTSRRNPASGGGSAITFDRAVILSGGIPSPTPPPTSPPPTPSPTSPPPTPSPTGPPPTFWLSGGSRNSNTQAAAVEWGNMRGRAVNLVTVYSTRDAGWDAFVNTHATSGQPAAYNNTYTLIIQTAPFPENTGSTYAALVAGSYDTYWRRIGTLLQNKVNQGFPAPIVSVAWEFNGSYMYWGGCAGDSRHYSSPAQYIAAYRRIVQQLRATYPSVQTAWTINAHSTPSCTGSSDVSAFYPGDDVVTYIGTDDYDHYPPAPNKGAFDSRATANGGLYYMGNLARSHGKQIIVPEWGVAPGSGGNGTGDNANYIQWMYETFLAWWNQNPRLLKGEFYFADPCGGGNVDSDLVACNPNSRARYQSLW